jgi:hypothetical protein
LGDEFADFVPLEPCRAVAGVDVDPFEFARFTDVGIMYVLGVYDPATIDSLTIDVVGPTGHLVQRDGVFAYVGPSTGRVRGMTGTGPRYRIDLSCDLVAGCD